MVADTLHLFNAVGVEVNAELDRPRQASSIGERHWSGACDLSHLDGKRISTGCVSVKNAAPSDLVAPAARLTEQKYEAKFAKSPLAHRKGLVLREVS